MEYRQERSFDLHRRFHIAQNFGGIASRYCVVGYIFGNDAARAYDGVFADSHTRENGRAGTNRGTLFDESSLHFPVCLSLQPSLLRCRARVGIVDEGDTVSNEHIVFDSNAFTNKRMARDLATFANVGILLHLNKSAYL